MSRPYNPEIDGPRQNLRPRGRVVDANTYSYRNLGRRPGGSGLFGLRGVDNTQLKIQGPITDRNIASILSGLSAERNFLVSIDLSGCQLSDRAALFLTRQLRHMPNLQRVNFANNNLSRQTILEIRRALSATEERQTFLQGVIDRSSSVYKNYYSNEICDFNNLTKEIFKFVGDIADITIDTDKAKAKRKSKDEDDEKEQEENGSKSKKCLVM